MKICKKCSAKNNDKASFCTVCGSDELMAEAKKGNKSLLIGIVIGVVIAVAAFAASGGQGDDDTKSSESTRFTFNYETGTSVTATTEKPTSQQSFITTTATTAATTAAQRYTQPAEEVYPISLRLTSELQHTMNLFLSNFSEANMKSFETFPGAEEALDFALSFNFINKKENFELLNSPVTFNGRSYNYRIKEDTIKNTVYNYFHVTQVLPSFGHNLINYKDGYFYYQFTGGMIMDDVTIVTAVRQIDRYSYEVDFRLYDAASNNRNMYTMDDSQVQSEMQSKPFIRYTGSGTAVISSEDIYKHNACRLESYRLY